ncbi:trehalose-phosphatase [Qaidamihabitans albus]|uniref:trehalose-phosphatase n=1 Tax=Qaidamihabitans albus TaxID=2795733 RepID=UPI0018F17129|nr:trehalose-phosphatase [Qaidamihabitans albus]
MATIDVPAEMLPADLRASLGHAARTPRLLVGCDYDGTLAELVPDPESATPVAESVRALRALAGMHETSAAVISGRALRDLATLSRLPAEVILVGSHGSEFDVGFVRQLDGEAVALKRRLHRDVHELTNGAEGVLIEEKPSGMAVHVRNAAPTVAERILRQARETAARHPGVQAVEGKEVIDLSVVPTDKGDALTALRQRAGATATVFIGDSVTDERAFERLTGADVTIKVGAGPTSAHYRVTDPAQASVVLAFLAEQRRSWLFGEQAPPIERLSMLGNGRAVALVTPDSRITWMCQPEPDSAALFAHLLGGDGAGHFSVNPLARGLPLGQRYLPGTMTVETRWAGLTVTDYLDHTADAERTDLVRVLDGDVPAVVEFAPRPEFGQVPVRLRQEAGGLRITGLSDPIVLYAPGVEWRVGSDGTHDVATATVHPSVDRPVVLELRCGVDDLSAESVPEPVRRAASGEHWSAWLGGLRLPALERELVARSALTLRALCHSGTGAIIAAATTSLPEEIGGVRNWDYRYCWIRDAALTAKALVSLGSHGEAEAFLGWLRGVVAATAGPERLHPLYAVSGAPLGPEAVLDGLPGYAGSRPVRVGNLANQQVQLDVFGPVVDLVADLAARKGSVGKEEWALVRAMVDAVARRWHEPDHGLWEERSRTRHHVYSKVMCWLAVDRALWLAGTFHVEADPTWPSLRAEIAGDVLTRGWSERRGSYTAAYDGVDLDAATLHIGLSGLLDPGSERFRSTVAATEASLRRGPTVFRYLRDDGLPGEEGGFHLCTAWLIESYLLTGRRTDAEELFKLLADTAGPTGLLPEEYDPLAERSLGNHPQAYSHLGLIRCAQLLSESS